MHGNRSVTTETLGPRALSLALAVALVLVVPAWAQQPPAEQSEKPTPSEEKKAQAEEEKPEPAKKPAPAATQARRGAMQLRDPFVAQVAGAAGGAGGAAGRQLPPGIRGLVISQVLVGGIVLGARGKIALVMMPGSDRAHFIREGDRLYDGVVKEIRGDRVIFRERSRDVFGNVKVRDVEKELTSLMEGPKRPGARR